MALHQGCSTLTRQADGAAELARRGARLSCGVAIRRGAFCTKVATKSLKPVLKIGLPSPVHGRACLKPITYESRKTGIGSSENRVSSKNPPKLFQVVHRMPTTAQLHKNLDLCAEQREDAGTGILLEECRLK